MMQNVVVAVLVVGCFVYALWTLSPKALRSRFATQALKLPLPMLLQRPLTAAAMQTGGCGCGGCDRSAAVQRPAALGVDAARIEPGYQPVTFVRGSYAKKSSR